MKIRPGEQNEPADRARMRYRYDPGLEEVLQP